MLARDTRPQTAGVTTYMPKMRQVARRILGREDLAADAVQEALISFHQIAVLPQNEEAWLLRTVTHRSLATRRAHLRRLRNEGRAAQETAGRIVYPDPERELVRRELAQRIAAALRTLPAAQREAFLLREIHGLDYEEISGAQEVPIGTVRSRLNRARRELRSRLGAPRMPLAGPTVAA